MDFENYLMIQEEQDYVLVQNKQNQIYYIYREFEIPKFIGNKQIIPKSQLIENLENRKSLQTPNILHLSEYSLTSKLCLLYEQALKNFDEELAKRRNTTQFWSEEELYNTFQACLGALKTYHEFNIAHGAICPKSIIFSQDSQVKLADHFVIGEEYRMNWKDEPKQDEYGYWAPEIVNVYEGWKYKYETIENDIWGLGLVFLEAMTLKSGFDYYFLDNANRLYIDFHLIEESFTSMRGRYSTELIELISIMLAIDPLDRNWDQIIMQNGKLQDLFTNKISITPIPEESEEDSQTSTFRSEVKVETEKTRLLGMLENCLQKSKQLIVENESRKSKRPSCENFAISQQSPCKEDANSSLLMLMKGKHSKKNSTDSNCSILKEIPMNKQRRKRECLKKIRIDSSNKGDPGVFDPNNLSNFMEQYQTYIGESKNGRMHGNGQLKFKNGAVLQGSFQDGNIHGYGILVVNNEMIVGNWSNNLLTQIM